MLGIAAIPAVCDVLLCDEAHSARNVASEILTYEWRGSAEQDRGAGRGLFPDRRRENLY